MPRVLLRVAACLIGGGSALSAQNATLRGSVTDPGGVGIPNATVEIVGTLRRTRTFADGAFEIVVPARNWSLRVRQLGFLPESVAVAPPFAPVSVVLKHHPIELKGITVVGGGTPLMGQTVTSSTVRQVPPLGEPDIFRAVALLPGVSQPNDLRGRIHLAGGTSDETGVELNGHPLQDPFHLLGVLGAFNTAALDRADVLIHHMPVESEGRLSGLIALQSRQSATPKREAVVSLLSTSITVVQPRAIAGSDLLVSGRITYLDRLIGALGERAKINGDEPTVLGYRDAVVTLDRSFRNTAVGAVFFHARDRRPMTDAEEYSWGETLGGLRMTARKGSWAFGSRASFNRATGNLGRTTGLSTEQYVNLRHDWFSGQMSVKRFVESWNWETGIGIDTRTTAQQWTRAPDGFFSPRTPREYSGSQAQQRPAAFAEISKALTRATTATFATRITRVDGRSFSSPRALLARSFPNGAILSLAASRRNQFDTELEEPSEGSGKQPLFLLSRPRRADVAALSVRRATASGGDWEIVSFYKAYEDRARLIGDPRREADSSGALPAGFPLFDRTPGRSFGAAWSFTRRFGSRSLVQGSYTFQKVSEEIGGAYFPTAWDAPHSVSVFGTTPISRFWTFNVVTQWHSGQATTPVSARIFVPDDEFSPFLRPRYLPAELNSGRLPDYRRVDIGVRRDWKRGKTEIAFSAQVLNVFARRNALEYDWASAYCHDSDACKSPKPTRSGLPIIPSLGLEVRW